jgi:adenylate kinase family enzyme
VLVDPPHDLTRHPRIVLHGVTGSGRSTPAARLAALTGAPLVSVDDLMWRPGWVQLTDEEQVEAIRPWAQRPAWVMDSLWSATRPVVLPRADLLVTLDFPRRVSLTRLLARTVRRARTGEEFCGGNTESWRRALSTDSIVAWWCASPHRARSTPGYAPRACPRREPPRFEVIRWCRRPEHHLERLQLSRVRGDPLVLPTRTSPRTSAVTTAGAPWVEPA